MDTRNMHLKNPIRDRREISPPNSGLRVVQLILTDEARQALSVGVAASDRKPRGGTSPIGPRPSNAA